VSLVYLIGLVDFKRDYFKKIAIIKSGNTNNIYSFIGFLFNNLCYALNFQKTFKFEAWAIQAAQS